VKGDMTRDESAASMDRVEMIPVKSALLEAIGYNPEMAVLILRFVSHSAAYAYHGVARDVYEALLEADSKGAFFHKNIDGRYPHERV